MLQGPSSPSRISSLRHIMARFVAYFCTGNAVTPLRRKWGIERLEFHVSAAFQAPLQGRNWSDPGSFNHCRHSGRAHPHVARGRTPVPFDVMA